MRRKEGIGRSEGPNPDIPPFLGDTAVDRPQPSRWDRTPESFAKAKETLRRNHPQDELVRVWRLIGLIVGGQSDAQAAHGPKAQALKEEYPGLYEEAVQLRAQAREIASKYTKTGW